MRKRLVALFCAALAAAPLSLVPAQTVSSTPGPCGLTTLDATIVDTNNDGILECGAGEATTTRNDFGTVAGVPTGPEKTLLSFVALADFQLADEESPARGEWADKCGSVPTSSAFRPHESMVAHMLNAHVNAAAAIAANGGPKTGDDIKFVVALGDLADNQQYNETRWFIDMMDGGKLINPDSGNDPLLGGDGYDGVQGADPTGSPASPLTSPVTGSPLLDVANEPFWALGLKVGSKHIPWFSVIGNHDVKVQGTVPDDNPAWRAFIREYVKGRTKVMDIAPDYQQELCADPSKFGDPNFWMKVLANPGTSKVVPKDDDRRLLDRAEWMNEHFTTSGTPSGHGFDESAGASTRCRDALGNVLPRACYSAVKAGFKHIVLDTSPAEGLEAGNLDPDQFDWLERELVSASESYYNAAGVLTANPTGTNKKIVVYGHHTIGSMDNTGFPPGTALGVKTGDDVEALLLRFPNVILQMSGHTHENRIIAHSNATLGTGYWEVNTSAIADRPHQGRVIEIVDNKDGTLSIFATVFDARTAVDPRTIAWGADDPTNEVALAGAAAAINEDWLASAGREIGFLDPQADLMAVGAPGDRNVELLIDKPF